MINKIIIHNGPDDEETVIDVNPGATIHILTDNGFKTVVYDANDLSGQIIDVYDSERNIVTEASFSYEE